MTPTIDGKTHHFGHRGLYNALSVLGDAETGSYWDHVTGECLHGSLKGRSLDIAPLLHMTAEQAARRADMLLARSKPSLFAKILGRIAEWTRLSRRGFLPPGFRSTMSKPDSRLPEMEMGLGVWSGQVSRFYPIRTLRQAGGVIVDSLDRDRKVAVYIDRQSGIPAAIESAVDLISIEGRQIRIGEKVLREGLLIDANGASTPARSPMQLFTRWYGFSFTFPKCEIFDGMKQKQASD